MRGYSSFNAKGDKRQPMEQEFDVFFEEQKDLLTEGSVDSTEERYLKVRLDKWLWAARFFKTRALARAAIEAGKVYYNGERSKPSREIDLGASLQIQQGRFIKTVIIQGLSTRRRSTEESLQLFKEVEASRLARPHFAQSFSTHAQRQTPRFPFTPPSAEPVQRRPVRFLRRAFTRQDPFQRNEFAPAPRHPKKEFEYWE